jgi:hypothetical protein
MSRIERIVTEEQYEKQTSQQRNGFDVVAGIWNATHLEVCIAAAASVSRLHQPHTPHPHKHHAAHMKPRKAA